MLHRLGYLVSVQDRRYLIECFDSTAVIILAPCVQIDIVGDGLRPGLGHRVIYPSVGEDVDVAVVHIYHEYGSALLPEQFAVSFPCIICSIPGIAAVCYERGAAVSGNGKHVGVQIFLLLFCQEICIIPDHYEVFRRNHRRIISCFRKQYVQDHRYHHNGYGYDENDAPCLPVYLTEPLDEALLFLFLFSHQASPPLSFVKRGRSLMVSLFWALTTSKAVHTVMSMETMPAA